MKNFKFSFLIAVFALCFLITGSAFAQTHFHKCWEGQGAFQPMSIYVVEAKVNGVDLESGDEIGIFDIEDVSYISKAKFIRLPYRNDHSSIREGK